MYTYTHTYIYKLMEPEVILMLVAQKSMGFGGQWPLDSKLYRDVCAKKWSKVRRLYILSTALKGAATKMGSYNLSCTKVQRQFMIWETCSILIYVCVCMF